MDTPTTVREMMEYLQKHGYDGLRNEDIPCYCRADDVCCHNTFQDCRPAYKGQCSGCGTTLYGPAKSTIKQCGYCGDEEAERKQS